MQVSEAWALTQLGSLRSLQHKPEEALHYAEKALAFYQQRGYRKWLSLTLPIVGRAYRDRGEYEPALKLFEDQVKLGEQLGDQFQVGMADLDIGNVLSDEEQYPNALQSFDKSYDIFKSLKADSYIAYAAENRASMLWQLGRSAKASEALSEASSIIEGREEANKQLLAHIHLTSSLLELSDGHVAESRVKSRKALEVAGNQYIDVAIQAKQTLAEIQVRSGAGRAAKILTADAINLANATADPQLIYGALLASAEAMLANSEAQAALEVALRVQQSFAHYGKQDSEWRAWLIAAHASRQLGKNSVAREYALNANARLSDLEQRWGSEAYSSYAARPDRAQLRNELNDLLKP
jgi:hypothetical protein